MPRPWLVLDCYVDGGGDDNFTRHLGGPWQVCRPPSEPLPLDPTGFRGVLVSGSAAGVNDRLPWAGRLVRFVRRAVDLRVPVLGVCFGHQVLAEAVAGPGAIRLSPTPEVGWFHIQQDNAAPSPILAGLPARFQTFLSHFDEVDPALRHHVTVQASSERCPVQALAVPGRPAWGVQFHAEMLAEETSRLVHLFVGDRLPGQPEAVLADAVDSTPLIERMLANFAQQTS